jgi:signal peptidase I
MNKARKFLKKLWYFIWEDDSIWSWIVNIGLAFLIIRFIFYPGLGFMLGTTHPVVAVVSSSMEHPGSFDDWWSTQCCMDNPQLCLVKSTQQELYRDWYSITKDEFKEFRFKNGFNKGDIMVLASPKNIKVGDTIVYTSSEYPEPIIHRVVRINETTGMYNTKGDHNCQVAGFESRISKEHVLGKAVVRVPFLGWLKVFFVDLLKLIHIA